MMEALNISGSLKFTNKPNCCFPNIRRRDILLPNIATAGHPNANRNNNSTLLTRLVVSLHNNNNNRIASLLPIISASRLSYHAQINDFQDDDHDQIQDLGRSSTRKVNVKFQLQRECSYGDQFYLVGDDPMFGSWNPQNAVPLHWSEGHLWTANLDIAIGKTIQYKFLLKGGGGGCIEDHLTWQPGSDRVLTTWETSKRIVVCEDWDDVLVQKIMEEEDETMPLMLQQQEEEEEEEISNGAPEKEEVLIKETTAAAMEDVISRASSSYGGAKMVEEEPEVTTA